MVVWVAAFLKRSCANFCEWPASAALSALRVLLLVLLQVPPLLVLQQLGPFLVSVRLVPRIPWLLIWLLWIILMHLRREGPLLR